MILKVWIMKKKIYIHHLLYLNHNCISTFIPYGASSVSRSSIGSELLGGAKPTLNVVEARQQLQNLKQALARNIHASRIQSSITDSFSPLESS